MATNPDITRITPWAGGRDWYAEIGVTPDDVMQMPAAWQYIKAQAHLWYVYVLWRPDFSPIEPFYIGKGMKRRYSHHIRPSVNNHNNFKKGVILDMRVRGIQPLISFIETGLTHQDHALELEENLIRKIGRRLTGDGPLCNITVGGLGRKDYPHKRGAENPRSRPVVINGKRYAGMSEAVRQTGLSNATIYERCRKGVPGNYFVDEGPQPRKSFGRRQGADNPKSRAVWAEGRLFTTLTEAALALGTNVPRIIKRIQYGWDGYHYADEEQKPRRPTRGMHPNSRRRIEINGVVYPSVKSGCNAIGVRTTDIYNLIDKGKLQARLLPRDVKR